MVSGAIDDVLTARVMSPAARIRGGSVTCRAAVVSSVGPAWRASQSPGNPVQRHATLAAQLRKSSRAARQPSLTLADERELRLASHAKVVHRSA
jgi:hypothetical protein